MAELYNTMISLAEQLYAATRALLVQRGVKSNSDLVRSIEIRADADLIRMLSNDYMDYVSSGRRAYAKKVPIRYLLDFIKKNNIKGVSRGMGKNKTMTDNQMAFAIQHSIYVNGIKGKNFMASLEELFASMGENKISTDVEQKMYNMLDNLKLN